MATVINNPKDGSDSSVGVIVGIILLLVLVGLFVVYALPAIRGNTTPPLNDSIDVNIKLPSMESSPVSPTLTPAPGSPTY
jgi:hypothetical protein